MHERTKKTLKKKKNSYKICQFLFENNVFIAHIYFDNKNK